MFLSTTVAKIISCDGEVPFPYEIESILIGAHCSNLRGFQCKATFRHVSSLGSKSITLGSDLEDFTCAHWSQHGIRIFAILNGRTCICEEGQCCLVYPSAIHFTEMFDKVRSIDWRRFINPKREWIRTELLINARRVRIQVANIDIAFCYLTIEQCK